MDITSINLVLLGSTFGLIMRMFIQNNLKEITLLSKTSLYSFPGTNSKELLVLNTGTSLSILRNWIVSENEIWYRVELSSNKLLDDPNKIRKGWIKM